jgi:predicted membrane protein
MTPDPDPMTRPPHGPRLWIGVSVILLGVALTLDNLGLVDASVLFRFSPILLVAYGVYRIRRDPEHRSVSGTLLVLAGLFLLVVNFGPARLSNAVGPMLLVLLGIFLVLKALQKSRGQGSPGMAPRAPGHEGYHTCTAVFGGCKRRPQLTTFRGAEMTAIFGGVELDLRQAVRDEGEIRVDVFVLFGAGEISVPQHWDVVMRATAIAGAAEDKTLHLPGDPSAEGSSRPRLVVTGLALFGGVAVKN